jgi:exodeoxyribonuclease VII small subunit
MAEKRISYEDAREELAQVVEELESGELGLEESLKLWERGEELVKICEEWLEGAKAKIAKASAAKTSNTKRTVDGGDSDA